jgi:hypothetical protein
MANVIVLEVSDVQPGVGNAPGTIIGFENGEPRTIKAFEEILTQFKAGKVYEFEWYMGKPYQGQQDMLVSKHGTIKDHGIARPGIRDNPRAAESPPQAPQRVPPPAPAAAPQKQQNTPQGVMTGAAGTKDRSITILAVMKSVIESGGSEDDFRRWLELHDETLSMHGKKRGD